MQKLIPVLFVAMALGLGHPTILQAKEDKTQPVSEKEKNAFKRVLDAIQMDERKQSDHQQSVRTIYDDGFTLASEDDILKIGVWMQNDVRVFFKGHPGDTQFLVRRARLDFRGSLEKMFGYRVMGEFEGDGGTNAANLKEG